MKKLSAMKIGETIITAESGTGKVIKNHSLTKDQPLDFGFVKTPKSKEDIAFTPNTKLKGYKKLSDLKIGTSVKLSWKQTSRGPLATIIEKR